MMPDAIGRYQVFGHLGAGGFATVYRAYDPRLDRDVAIKVLHPSLAGDPDMRGRFLLEARALASVRHPHLVRLFDAGEADGVVYLAMEFIAGRSLDTVVRGPLPVDYVCRIVSQIASALDALHDSGLVHRDVKPANIMLADDGGAILVDLGVARSLNTAGITSPSVVMGTPGFLAPEQLGEAEPAGPRTDVYQLAATAYTLLTGGPPFQGSPAEVLYAVAHRAAPDPRDVCPDLPASMAAAIIEALAKDPRRRPARAGTFAASLINATLPETLILPLPASAVATEKTIAENMATSPDGAAVPMYERRRVEGTAHTAASTRQGRRAVLRWPLAIAAAGVALVLLGSSVAAVSYRHDDGNDAPRVTLEEAGRSSAWPAPAKEGARRSRQPATPRHPGDRPRPTSRR